MALTEKTLLDLFEDVYPSGAGAVAVFLNKVDGHYPPQIPDHLLLDNPTYLRRLGLLIGTVDVAALKSLFETLNLADRNQAIGSVTIAFRYQLEAATSFGPGASRPVAYGLDLLSIRDLWKQHIYGDDILIGHVDSGVDAEHRALQCALDSFAYVSPDGCVNERVKRGDTCWHGTWTAGILVGRKLPDEVVVVGAAPGAKLASAIIGNCTDTDERFVRIARAVDWALEKRVRIINFSIGMIVPTPMQTRIQRTAKNESQNFADVLGVLNPYECLVDRILNHNVLPVCSVGNNGLNSSVSPGNCMNALSVGACNEKEQVWDRSSTQNAGFGSALRNVPDLIAPGVAVTSCLPTDYEIDWGLATGTSASAAYISGMAALLMQARPGRTAKEVRDAIFKSCPQASAAGQVGRGIPNAVRALNYL